MQKSISTQEQGLESELEKYGLAFLAPVLDKEEYAGLLQGDFGTSMLAELGVKRLVFGEEKESEISKFAQTAIENLSEFKECYVENMRYELESDDGLDVHMKAAKAFRKTIDGLGYVFAETRRPANCMNYGYFDCDTASLLLKQLAEGFGIEFEFASMKTNKESERPDHAQLIYDDVQGERQFVSSDYLMEKFLFEEERNPSPDDGQILGQEGQIETVHVKNIFEILFEELDSKFENGEISPEAHEYLKGVFSFENERDEILDRLVGTCSLDSKAQEKEYVEKTFASNETIIKQIVWILEEESKSIYSKHFAEGEKYGAYEVPTIIKIVKSLVDEGILAFRSERLRDEDYRAYANEFLESAVFYITEITKKEFNYAIREHKGTWVILVREKDWEK
jgi:hypothetical protein